MLIIRDPNQPLYLDFHRQVETLQRLLGAVARDREISGEALRVLLYLYSTITLGTCTSNINKAQIGRDLGMKGQNVGRAFRLLMQKNLLTQHPTMISDKGIGPNPDYALPEPNPR